MSFYSIPNKSENERKDINLFFFLRKFVESSFKINKKMRFSWPPNTINLVRKKKVQGQNDY